MACLNCRQFEEAPGLTGVTGVQRNQCHSNAAIQGAGEQGKGVIAEVETESLAHITTELFQEHHWLGTSSQLSWFRGSTLTLPRLPRRMVIFRRCRAAKLPWGGWSGAFPNSGKGLEFLQDYTLAGEEDVKWLNGVCLALASMFPGSWIQVSAFPRKPCHTFRHTLCPQYPLWGWWMGR